MNSRATALIEIRPTARQTVVAGSRSEFRNAATFVVFWAFPRSVVIFNAATFRYINGSATPLVL
jgi:hypothetical protein